MKLEVKDILDNVSVVIIYGGLFLAVVHAWTWYLCLLYEFIFWGMK